MQAIYLGIICSLLFYTPLLCAEEVKTAGEPFFTITSNTPHVQIINGNTPSITYHIKNNTTFPDGLANNGFIDLPTGITPVVTDEPGTCSHPFNLAAKGKAEDSCLATLLIDTNAMTSYLVRGGPIVCNTYDHPVHCYQPASDQQMQIEVVPADSPDLPVLEIRSAEDNCDSLSTPNCYIITELGDLSITIDVVNTGLTDAVEVQINPAASLMLASYSPTSCDIIPANGGICSVTFTASVAEVAGAVTFSSDFNVNPVSMELHVLENGILTYDLNFSSPGEQEFTIVNLTTLDTTIQNIILGPDVSGINITESCPILSGGVGNTCAVPFVATDLAYGADNVTVNYIYAQGSGPFYAETEILVANNAITINDSAPIVFYWEEVKKSIPITNTGEFTLQDITFALQLPSPSFPITVSAGSCSTTLEAGDTCNLELINTGLGENDQGSTVILEINAVNIQTAPTEKNIAIAEGFSLAKAIDSPHIVGGVGQHMQYQAIGLGNTLPGEVTLTNIDFTLAANLESGIEVCNASGTGCDGYNNPNANQAPICVNGMTLYTNQFCLIWLKAIDNQQGLSKIVTTDGLEIAVTFEFESNYYTLSSTFPLTYAVSLYAGGAFTSVAGVGTTNLVSYTGGSNWSSMSTENFNSPSTVYDLAIYQGDLYAAGNFMVNNISARAIASWNGTRWQAVGKTLNNAMPFRGGAARVRNLKVANNKLYASGLFTEVVSTVNGVSQIIPAAYAAVWDNTTWNGIPNISTGTQLSTTGNELITEAIGATVFNGELCVGATSSKVSPPIATVQCFNGTNAWNTLSSSSFNGIFNSGITTAMTTTPGTPETLYVIGQFIDAPASKSIAQYANGAWSSTGTVDANGRQLNFSANGARAIQPAPTHASNSIYVSGAGTAGSGGSAITLNQIAFATTQPASGASAWTALPNNGTSTNPGIGGGGNLVTAITFGYNSSGNLSVVYVGGLFTTAGGNPAANGAYWDSSKASARWTALPAVSPQSSGSINTLLVAPSLVVGEPTLSKMRLHIP